MDPIELVCWLPALCRKKDRGGDEYGDGAMSCGCENGVFFDFKKHVLFLTKCYYNAYHDDKVHKMEMIRNDGNGEPIFGF